MFNEWDVLMNIFTRGDYCLDNNLVERLNSTDTYHCPEGILFSSGHMLAKGLPFSIRLHAHADCKASTSLSMYLMSSTKRLYCRQEHHFANIGTCCQMDENKKISLKNKILSDIFWLYARHEHYLMGASPE